MGMLSQILLKDEEDKQRWTLTKSGIFSVRSCYRWLVRALGEAVSFLHKQIWKLKIPPRVSFFTWEASQECILTVDKLKRRGLVIVNGCVLCLKDEESCNHLLLSCPVTFELWRVVYRTLGIDWVMAGTVRDELWAWVFLRDMFFCGCYSTLCVVVSLEGKE